MALIKGIFRTLRLNKRAIEREINATLTDALHLGTRAFVAEIAARVPAWTGESLGSLKPLADLVGHPLLINVSATAPFNAISLGASQGAAQLREGPDVWAMSWRSRVDHFAFNELNNANLVGFHLIRPGPYHSIPAGGTAFRSVFLARARDIDLSDKVIGFGAEIQV